MLKNSRGFVSLNKAMSGAAVSLWRWSIDLYWHIHPLTRPHSISGHSSYFKAWIIGYKCLCKLAQCSDRTWDLLKPTLNQNHHIYSPNRCFWFYCGWFVSAHYSKRGKQSSSSLSSKCNNLLHLWNEFAFWLTSLKGHGLVG